MVEHKELDIDYIYTADPVEFFPVAIYPDRFVGIFNFRKPTWKLAEFSNRSVIELIFALGWEE